MKLNYQRKASWLRFYGRTTSLAAAISTGDGGFVFTGVGDQGPIILKIDATGNIIWQKILKAPGMPSSITATADGGYVVGGIIRFWGIRGWAVKLDSVGHVAWSKSFPGQIGGVVEAVRQENDGHILIMGFTAAGEHRHHIWSARFDLKGGLISQQAYGEARTGYVQVGAIHGTPDDGTLFVGSRETNSRGYGLIGRTSWEGNVCTAFEKSTGVLISNWILRTKPAHLRIREGTFDVQKPKFVAKVVDTKIVDLCK